MAFRYTRHRPARNVMNRPCVQGSWGPLLLAGLSLLAGCAAVGTVAQRATARSAWSAPPGDRIVQLFEQRYLRDPAHPQPQRRRVMTRAGHGATKSTVNDKLFGQGVSAEGFTVPAYGDEHRLDVVVVSNLHARSWSSSSELGARDKKTITLRLRHQPARSAWRGSWAMMPFAARGRDSRCPGWSERPSKGGGKSKAIAI